MGYLLSVKKAIHNYCNHGAKHNSHISSSPGEEAGGGGRVREFLLIKCHAAPCAKSNTIKDYKLTTHQSQFEQFGDDPVKHPSVVLLVDLVCDLLDNVFCCQRSAVNLTEAFWVI